MTKIKAAKRIEAFDFIPGRVLAGKYEVVQRLGAGWEGEVYLLRERATGIERAAKFFFPHRNPGGKTSTLYARKLHKLRGCPIVVRYHSWEAITFRGVEISFLVSEFVEGQILSEFLAAQPGKRLSAFEGIHLLYKLAAGIEMIHNLGDYHGDLHLDNILVMRHGLSFSTRLVDMYYWGPPSAELIHDDVVNLIRIFYDAIGGQKYYAKHPAVAKQICSGLKRSLILKKYKTAGQLRNYLENLEWN